jgi:hypothetical protein
MVATRASQENRQRVALNDRIYMAEDMKEN